MPDLKRGPEGFWHSTQIQSSSHEKMAASKQVAFNLELGD